MNVFDVLILGAELSLALAGFAGIIATFQFRDSFTDSRRTAGSRACWEPSDRGSRGIWDAEKSRRAFVGDLGDDIS